MKSIQNWSYHESVEFMLTISMDHGQQFFMVAICLLNQGRKRYKPSWNYKLTTVLAIWQA